MSDSKFDRLKLENQICFPLYAASRQVIKMYRPYLEPMDLTYTQYVVLLVLWEKNSISAGELGRRLILDSGTLTPVLKSMEAKGLIRRYRSLEDERVLNVEITEEGKNLREKAMAIPEEQATHGRLSAREEAELHRLLYKIIGTEEQ